ncbi:glycosyltransferase family 61 protein [Ruegeria pomeroyi]|uniref:Glycosyltransferase family 61 protein n=1 Tax=Ruegeria pomeroyi TaxID=89184 RepID=A0A9Q3ZND1_9RHOB|nr:glycosyltransferase 61 family protein [Ruegeria pomeroyi]MCE8539038.1 glycosyltransferase family 61 protein [Ruegeria pomeroyi]
MAQAPELDPNDPTTQPQPNGGWSEGLDTLTGAIVVPPEVSGFTQEAGVLYSDGRYCPQGALWRRYRPLTTEPPMPESVSETLSGRWLWGGVLWAHFGHFLVESTARLWALDHIEGPIDGVLFIPKRPRVGDQIRGFQRDFIDLMRPDLPIHVATAPTRVEELIVPGQGFGLGPITQGTQKFRDAIHAGFGKSVEPDGPSKIYISRSALGLGKGGMLGEERLEDLLRAEGYDVFHPEKYNLETQLARYKAATHVIAADGSALHLYAMVGRPDQKVAMILRRKAGATNLLAKNVAHFCRCNPMVIDALYTEWVRGEGGKSNRLSFGELDHAVIGRGLAMGGFVRPDVDWPRATDEERAQMFRDKGLDQAGDFVESEEYQKRRRRIMRQERRARRAARDDAAADQTSEIKAS